MDASACPLPQVGRGGGFVARPSVCGERVDAPVSVIAAKAANDEIGFALGLLNPQALR
jgi:hypothetical protein